MSPFTPNKAGMYRNLLPRCCASMAFITIVRASWCLPGNEARSKVADKVDVEHFVMLSVKLFQSSLQQRNPLAEIILKEQPLTSQASRYGTVGLQGVGRRELGQLHDVLLRPARIRQRQIDRKNQAQRSTRRGWMIGFFSVLYGAFCVIK